MQTLSQGGYEMLRAAVNTARQFECKSVKALTDRLLMTFPGRDFEINEAIQFWAESISDRYPNCVPAI